MKLAEYRRIRGLFDEALQQPESARAAWVRQAAGGDQDLAAAVLRLMDASDRAGAMLTAATTGRYGPYEIESKLGEGGMGVVYLARRADGAFQKQVAIKVLRRELATPAFAARFQRERDILAKLEHPNIARLIDGGTSPEGEIYLVMEYVQGEPLREYAQSRQLTYDARLALLRQVAEAVDYAHSQSVVHRDLKPSNIFVTRDGRAKLLDFGIAAWQQQQSTDTGVQGLTIGLSPGYASPEQVRGDATTKASDVYSLAMVAYELLTGTMPFAVRGAPVEDVLRAILEAEIEPPSESVRKSADPVILAAERQTIPWRLVTRLVETADKPLLQALSRDPLQRPSSAVALLEDLASAPMRRTAPLLETLGSLRELVLIAAMAILLYFSGWLTMTWQGWTLLGLLLAACALPKLSPAPFSIYGAFLLAAPFALAAFFLSDSDLLWWFGPVAPYYGYLEYVRSHRSRTLGETILECGSFRTYYTMLALVGIGWASIALPGCFAMPALPG